MKKIILLSGLFFICSMSLFSQTEISMKQGHRQVSGCDFRIYDNGGKSSDYESNSEDILTIVSTDTFYTCIEVRVDFVDIDPSDTLYIL